MIIQLTRHMKMNLLRDEQSNGQNIGKKEYNDLRDEAKEL